MKVAWSFLLGNLLQIFAILGIVFSIMASIDMMQSIAYDHLYGDLSNFGYELFDYLNDFFCAIEILFCLILLGIGSIVKNLQKSLLPSLKVDDVKPSPDKNLPLHPCACCHKLFENTELRLWENKLICRSCEKFIKK